MFERLEELIRHRDLVWMLASRDIRVRYKQSVMGFMWALLMPTMIVLAGVVVRYGYAMVSNTPLQVVDIASVAVKSLPWAFAVSSIRFATMSLVSNNNLVTKIYFPREVFPISAVLSSSFDFAVAACALAVFLVWAGVGVSAHLFWVPVLFVVLTMVLIGVSFALSAASLFFRDVKYLVEIVLTFGIFFTPVFYSTSMFGEMRVYMLMNPIAPVLEGLERTVVLHQSPDLPWIGYSAAFGIVSILGGYGYFKSVEPRFAESI